MSEGRILNLLILAAVALGVLVGSGIFGLLTGATPAT